MTTLNSHASLRNALGTSRPENLQESSYASHRV
jgi:hypothetical protein